MEEEKNNMDARIILYNQHYGFLENPTDFDFDHHPHRLIIKNYALRNNDRMIYEKYLKDFFPEQADQELLNFEAECAQIEAFSSKNLATWLMDNQVKVLQSDINETDKDAIFHVVPIGEDENPAHHLVEKDGFILKNISPLKVLEFPYRIWINKNSLKV